MLATGSALVGVVCGWLAVMLGRGHVANGPTLAWAGALLLFLFFLVPSGIWSLSGGLFAGVAARLLVVQGLTRDL